MLVSADNAMQVAELQRIERSGSRGGVSNRESAKATAV
jgi:hypothetical protein